MPKSKITGVTVSHIHDDDSATETKISRSLEGDDDPTVSLNQDGNIVYLRQESWEDIRDQIELMFQEIQVEQGANQ